MDKEIIKPSEEQRQALIQAAAKAAMNIMDVECGKPESDELEPAEITARVLRATREVERLVREATQKFYEPLRLRTDAEVRGYGVNVPGVVATAFHLSLIGGDADDVKGDWTIAGSALLSFAAAIMATRVMGDVGSLLDEGGEAFYASKSEIENLEAIGAMK